MKTISVKEEVNLAVIVYSGFMDLIPVFKSLFDMGWLEVDSTLAEKAIKLEEIEQKIEARKKAFSNFELPEEVKKEKNIKEKMNKIFLCLADLDKTQEFQDIIDVDLCLNISRDILCEKVKRLMVLNEENLNYKLEVYSKLEKQLTLEKKGFAIEHRKYITCEEHVFYLNIYNDSVVNPDLKKKKELTASEVLKIIQKDTKR